MVGSRLLPKKKKKMIRTKSLELKGKKKKKTIHLHDRCSNEIQNQVSSPKTKKEF